MMIIIVGVAVGSCQTLSSLRFVALGSWLLAAPAYGASFELHIKDHKLVPDKLTFPRGERVELVVHNDGPGTEEIESKSMRIEKIIPEGKSVTLKIGPLKPGTYDLFGEFNMATCTGTVVVE
jgi:hypothetical protein